MSRIITRTAAGKEPAVRVWTEAVPQERPPFSFRSHGRDGTPSERWLVAVAGCAHPHALGDDHQPRDANDSEVGWRAIRAASGGHAVTTFAKANTAKMMALTKSPNRIHG